MRAAHVFIFKYPVIAERALEELVDSKPLNILFKWYKLEQNVYLGDKHYNHI